MFHRRTSRAVKAVPASRWRNPTSDRLGGPVAAGAASSRSTRRRHLKADASVPISPRQSHWWRRTAPPAQRPADVPRIVVRSPVLFLLGRSSETTHPFAWMDDGGTGAPALRMLRTAVAAPYHAGVAGRLGRPPVAPPARHTGGRGREETLPPQPPPHQYPARVRVLTRRRGLLAGALPR